MFQVLMLRMVPPIVIVAPLSLYYSYVGLLDSMVGLGILYFLSSLPYAVWMTKSFIDEVPREVEQAAEILGASRWRTIFEVVLPLIRSGLVATFMFILILNWSEYLLALILSKTDVVTLPVELSKFEGSTEGRLFGRQAALSVGMTPWQTLVHVLLPQMLRVTWPSLGNYTSQLLKDTSIASAIAAPEIMFFARNLVTSTFETTLIYLAAMLLYAAMVLPVSWGFARAESRMENKR
jgi:ABC-type amino acid transport system permease subunit